MKKVVMKRFLLPVACLAAMTIGFLQAPASSHAGPIEITIDVAPSTLNLQFQGNVVTVHTDIGYILQTGKICGFSKS
jgi:hypothetical protein